MLNYIFITFMLIITATMTKGQECYFCNSASSNEDCNTNTVACGTNQGSCMTEVRVNGDDRRITKSCKQTAACENDARQNENNCNPSSSNYVCYFCCTGYLCNQLVDGATTTVTESASTTTSTETTTTTTTTAVQPSSTTISLALSSTTTTSLAASSSSSLETSTLTPQTSCEPLSAPRYGRISCTDGAEDRSRCKVTCDQDYELAQNVPASRRCVCFNGVCEWNGVPHICEYQADTPVVCDIPNFLKASYAVVDVWQTSAILKVSVRPNSLTRNGWSFLLMFARPLPEGFKVEAGDVILSSTSEDRRILTFNSLDHVNDISDYQVRDVFLRLSDLPQNTDASMYTAMVGFYDKFVVDGSCIDFISPLRPLPTTTAASTTTQSTTSTNSSPTTTQSTTSTTSTTTTTTAATTRSTTTTTRATITTSPPLSNDCEVLNDPNEPGYDVISNGWQSGGDWKFNAAVLKNVDDGDEVRDWTYKVEFDNDVEGIETYVASALQTENPKVWIFEPVSWNNILRRDQRITFIGTISGGSEAPNARVTFCQNGADPNLNPSPSEFSTSTTSSTTSSNQATSSGGPPTSSTLSPLFASNCFDTSPASYGSLPPSSSRTDPSSFNPSPYVSTDVPTPPGRTPFDYNEVLHLSTLFYQAQRSGRLPANNKIPWRGNSGLKDGCDVGVDLTGGFYDAGDNVKFGFPMAYTMTVLAWGMIEFRDAYESSGDWQTALDLLKWGTDYFIKAHPSKYEFYAQTADPAKDHGQWLRPEDIKYEQMSYKLDKNNPGSDVTAETAAALSAASIVFRSTQDSAYANTLVAHAEDLYAFATEYESVYDTSIPNVANYYKSWSGFQDELLWGGIWLYRATNNQQYLNMVTTAYDNYGAGNTPQEFSWDNKYAGVQVLMAQTTGDQKYIEDVRDFFAATQRIPTTPLGLTWKLQWGSNRYAANYAFIAVMAAKVVNLRNEETSSFINYAESQINYMLGKNEKLRSYVVGFGDESPQRPHHRSSSCPTWSNTNSVPACGFNSLNNPGPNPHVLYGALVGGPDREGEYEDDRTDYIKNEVAIDYNAGFQSTVAGLQHFAISGTL